MYRDVTGIDIQNCAVIVDDKRLDTYEKITAPDGIVKNYNLISNKYVQTGSTQAIAPNGAICLDNAQLQVIQSPYDFIYPIYETMAFATFFTIVFACYMLVIHPFWRTKV